MKINIKSLLGVFMLTLFLAASNQSQTLDQWKAAWSAAENNKGCESIPYENYRDRCIRQDEKGVKFCEKESWTCDGLETKKFRVDIQSTSEYVSRIKEERDRLNSQ